MQTEPLVNVDVPALLARLDEVTSLPEEAKPVMGAFLVDRWWRLNVAVDPQHTSEGFGNWKPGVSIYCCDPEGRFSTWRFVAYDECRLTESQVERMYKFIDRWVERGTKAIWSGQGRN